MRLTLDVRSGPDSRRVITIDPGPVVWVGRRPPAHVVLNDPAVSRIHFSVAFDGRAWRLKDMHSTHGTVVNHVRVFEASLHDGDVIEVGQSVLSVSFPEAASTASPTPLPALTTGTAETLEEVPVVAAPTHPVVAALRAVPGPLYAILDAARESSIPHLLQKCGTEYQSLYGGARGERYAAVAPYLVALPEGSALLGTLVEEGWGRSWGIYLTSAAPFAEVRTHFRKFITVENERGEQVLFRFYDPRVLRVFLPACASEELASFFAAVQGFLMESEDSGVFLRFQFDGRGLAREEVVVRGVPPPVPSVEGGVTERAVSDGSRTHELSRSAVVGDAGDGPDVASQHQIHPVAEVSVVVDHSWHPG